VVYFEAHLSPDVRTATEIAVEYICGQLQAGQRLSTNITRGEPWSDDARGFKSAKEIIGQYDGKRPGRVQIVRLDYDKVRRFVTERHATEIAFMRNGRKLKIKSSDFERAFRRHWRELAQVDSADPDFIAKVTKMVGTLKESGAQTVKMWNCASCGNTAQSASRPSSCSKCGKNAMTTAKI
jgi:rubrerythrin